MLDPFLFQALHQETNSKTEGIESPNDNYPELDKAIEEHVDQLMTAVNQSDKLLSPKARRAKLEQEVRLSADLSEFNKYMAEAFKILRTEGIHYLGTDEHNKVVACLDTLSQKLAALKLDSLNEDSLAEAILISPESQRSILQISIAKFNEGLSFDSLSLLTFLTSVNSAEPDYWYRLGLIAQDCENYDLALRAFAATSILAPDFIGARIFAAQCYLKNGMRADSINELNEAKRILETTDVLEEWRQHVTDVENLIKVGEIPKEA